MRTKAKSICSLFEKKPKETNKHTKEKKNTCLAVGVGYSVTALLKINEASAVPTLLLAA